MNAEEIFSASCELQGHVSGLFGGASSRGSHASRRMNRVLKLATVVEERGQTGSNLDALGRVASVP